MTDRPRQVRALFASRNWVLLLPSFVLLAFVLSILILLWVLYWHDREVEQAQVQRDLAYIDENIRRGLAADQEFLDRIARSVAASNEMSPAMATEAAEAVSESYTILNVIWNSPKGESLWGVASGRTVSQTLQERPNAVELERVLRLAAAMGRPTYTHPYRDYNDTAYIEYHAPIVRDGTSLGTISATLSLAGILEAFVPNQYAQKYQFGFIDSEARELFRQRQRSPFAELFTQSVVLTLPWREMRLEAKSYRSESPLARDVLAVITIVLLGILAWAVWLLQRHINRRIESDQALQASYQRFLTVFDALDAAVYVADLDDNHLLFVNEACRQRFPGGQLGGSIALLENTLAPLPFVVMPRRQLLGPEGPLAEAAKGEFEDSASGRWFLVRAKAIRWVDGRLVRMHVASDITDRKLAEESNRVQKERLMQTARLMTAGEMASTLAHEINQPLAAIANYTMGCVRRIRAGSWNEEHILAAMEKSAQQAERAGKVVSRMREFVRTREPNREAHNINDTITDVVRLTELETERTNVMVRLDLAGDLPTVLADRVMVEQVILNLVKNAIEAMQTTPTEQRTLVLTSRVVKDMAEVCVIDAGHGVDPAVEGDLFSPFFTTKRNGMGIGLNICRSIIELHGGHLWYARNRERGSTFCFTLPIVGERATRDVSRAANTI